MGVDHDTLRKLIGATSGDAASAASNRRAARGNGESSEAKFKRLLAPLVQTGTITREEAGELFRSSGDAKALRTKTEELMKAGKLTRKEAGELYSGAYPENAQRR